MNITKHVGTHSRQKVFVIFPEIPGEEHMCLVTYPESLPKIAREEVEKVLNSAMGQQSPSLSDALFKHYMPDGMQCLGFLHQNALMKKVRCEDVTMVLNPQTTILLSELNKHIKTLNESKEAKNSLKGIVDEMVSNETPSVETPVAVTENTTNVTESSPDKIQQLNDRVANLENKIDALLSKLTEVSKDAPVENKTTVTVEVKPETTETGVVPNAKKASRGRKAQPSN